MKSIIVEGPDNTGKSTLAQRLSSHFGVPLFRAGPAPSGFSMVRTCCDYQFGWMMQRACVFDRITPISHSCYHQLDTLEAQYLAGTLEVMLNRCIVIYCNTIFGMTRDTYETDQDDLLVKSQQTIVTDAYKTMMRNIVKPHVIFHGQDYNSVIANIRRIDQ